MESSIQHKRKEAMFLKVLSEIISEEVTNTENNYPTVTSVKLSKDDSHLIVFVTFAKDSKNSLIALKKAKGFIRSSLSKVPNLRRIPNLEFKIDDSLERAKRIENILNSLKEKK